MADRQIQARIYQQCSVTEETKQSRAAQKRRQFSPSMREKNQLRQVAAMCAGLMALCGTGTDLRRAIGEEG